MPYLVFPNVFFDLTLLLRGDTVRNIIFTLVVLAFVGCASTGPTISDNGMKTIVTTVPGNNQVPKWFVDTPKGTEDIFVTATDVSKDMQFAIDKAEISAKVKLAERLNVKVESLVTETSLESGAAIKDVEREIDRVSRVRTNATMSFYYRDKLEIVKEGKYFRAYVMLRLSEEDARKLTIADKRKDREYKIQQLDSIDQ